MTFYNNISQESSRMSQFHPVFPAEDLDKNTSRTVEIAGRQVLVCNAGGDFYAVQNLCTHQASSLEGGRIRNCFISCPLHGARFDLRDGSTKGALTSQPLETYEVRVVDGTVEVAVD